MLNCFREGKILAFSLRVIANSKLICSNLGSLRSPFQQPLKHIRANPGCRTVGMGKYKNAQQDNRDHTAVK